MAYGIRHTTRRRVRSLIHIDTLILTLICRATRALLSSGVGGYANMAPNSCVGVVCVVCVLCVTWLSSLGARRKASRLLSRRHRRRHRLCCWACIIVCVWVVEGVSCARLPWRVVQRDCEHTPGTVLVGLQHAHINPCALCVEWAEIGYQLTGRFA
jgi:hypothetical protein